MLCEYLEIASLIFKNVSYPIGIVKVEHEFRLTPFCIGLKACGEIYNPLVTVNYDAVVCNKRLSILVGCLVEIIILALGKYRAVSTVCLGVGEGNLCILDLGMKIIVKSVEITVVIHVPIRPCGIRILSHSECKSAVVPVKLAGVNKCIFAIKRCAVSLVIILEPKLNTSKLVNCDNAIGIVCACGELALSYSNICLNTVSCFVCHQSVVGGITEHMEFHRVVSILIELELGFTCCSAGFPCVLHSDGNLNCKFMSAYGYAMVEVTAHNSAIGVRAGNIERTVIILHNVLKQEVIANAVRTNEGLVIILKCLVVRRLYLIDIGLNNNIIHLKGMGYSVEYKLGMADRSKLSAEESFALIDHNHRATKVNYLKAELLSGCVFNVGLKLKVVKEAGIVLVVGEEKEVSLVHATKNESDHNALCLVGGNNNLASRGKSIQCNVKLVCIVINKVCAILVKGGNSTCDVICAVGIIPATVVGIAYILNSMGAKHNLNAKLDIGGGDSLAILCCTGAMNNLSILVKSEYEIRAHGTLCTNEFRKVFCLHQSCKLCLGEHNTTIHNRILINSNNAEGCVGGGFRRIYGIVCGIISGIISGIVRRIVRRIVCGIICGIICGIVRRIICGIVRRIICGIVCRIVCGFICRLIYRIVYRGFVHGRVVAAENSARSKCKHAENGQNCR